MRNSLFKSTSIVSAMTLLSRSLGFIRDIFLASLFGATAGFDAFLVAFKIPNFMRGLFSEGSFSQAFVPVLTEYQLTHSKFEIQQFIARTVGGLAGILLMLTLVCEIMTPLIVLLFAPGFFHDPQRYLMAEHMLRITFPYLMLISLTAFCGAILNTHNHFSGPSFTPVLLNIILILAAFYFSAKFVIPEEALAWGVCFAGIIQLLFQMPFLWRYKLLVKPSWHFKDKTVRRVLFNLFPALFGISVVQIGLLIDTLFASFLKQGSISWLYYADRLTFFPLGIFGVALATVVLPHLSSLHAQRLRNDFTVTLDWALRLLLIISLPATLGLVIMSGPLIVALYKHGEFTLFDVSMTQKSVIAFSLGLPGFMAIKILAAAFYSRRDLKLPVKIAIIATLLNIILNAVFISSLAHAGLALSTSISAIVNAFLLYIVLVKATIYKPLPGWNKFLIQLIFANGIMALLLFLGPPETATWLNWHWQQQLSNLLFWLSVAIAVYFSGLWVSGLRVRNFFHREVNGSHSRSL